MSSKHTILHLRREQKPLEHRSALTPSTTKTLICAGYEVHVERSPKDASRKRIYDDDEFERVGAKLVDDQSWSKIPRDHIIIGLELEPESFPLVHTHVHFAHCYKGQVGWEDVLSRFRRGGGTLLDLEFLQHADGSRVTELGYYNGLTGSAWAIKTWRWQLDHPGEQLPEVENFTQGRGYYLNEDEMLKQLRTDLRLGIEKAGRAPQVLVMGCLGRSGHGAVDLFLRIGLDHSQILEWDISEVVQGGPFWEIIESDIFINCAYLSDPTHPFLTADTLASASRKLSIICDLSFDAVNPHNLMPVYKVTSNSTSSTILVDVEGEPPLSVISIDHLSSLLPRESSEQLSLKLLPYLLELRDWPNNDVWSRAEKLFREKAATLPPDQVGSPRQSISQRMEPPRITDESWVHHSFKDEERQRWDIDDDFDEWDEWELRGWEWERRWDAQLDEYGHWIYEDPDNKFAKVYFESTKFALSKTIETSENTYLCHACRDIFSFDRQFTLSEIQDPNNNCQLCQLLYDCLLSRYDRIGGTFHVKRSGSFLKNTQDEKRILGLLSHPAPLLDNSSMVQVGVPNLYSIALSFLGGGSPYFELLRQWLKDCDEHHGNCATEQARYKPTRVLFVGIPDPSKVKLCEPTSPIDYIALSHRWGKPSDEDKKNYCTTSTNYKARLDEFPLNHLPKTFRDAVYVTRELGMEYLWIDSLCIIQEGRKSDWKHEAEKMQHVFAAAYCTISASSASSWDEGFLERRYSHRFIQVQEICGQQISISDNIDDFENDVENAQLNRRGWVVQERVLSRRTIHFTEKHTYWECGEGIRCENFAKTKYPLGRHYFLLDPRFPTRLKDSGYHRSIDFLQFLFQKYAQCGLTKKSDREVAIYSLMRHMETAFRTQYRYGTFRVFLHRLLLWHRSNEEIPENEHKQYEDQLPSWSWMTYAGIAFPSITHLKLADIQYDDWKDELRVQVRSLRNCKVKKEERRYWILNRLSERIGEVWFDKTDSQSKHCIIVGMEDDAEADADKTYWILVIKRRKASKDRSRSCFNRVGIGKVKALYVSKQGWDGKLM